MAPPRTIRTTRAGWPGAVYGAGTTAGASPLAASSSTSRSARLPALATSAATATGRSRWIARSRKMTKSRIPSPRKAPDIVTPRFGTASSSTARMSVYENVNVPMRTASTALNAQSR